MTTAQTFGASASSDSLPKDVAQLSVRSTDAHRHLAARIGTGAFLWQQSQPFSSEQHRIHGVVDGEEPHELSVRTMAIDHEGGLLLAAEECGLWLTSGPLAVACQLPTPPAVSFVQLACGGSHCLALAQGGVAWSWGRGSSGQLGHGDGTDRQQPQAVELQPEQAAAQFRRPEVVKVSAIAAGQAHSAFATAGGELLVCGAGGDGQLGLGQTAGAAAVGLDPSRRPRWSPTPLGPPQSTVVSAAAPSAAAPAPSAPSLASLGVRSLAASESSSSLCSSMRSPLGLRSATLSRRSAASTLLGAALGADGGDGGGEPDGWLLPACGARFSACVSRRRPRRGSNSEIAE